MQMRSELRWLQFECYSSLKHDIHPKIVAWIIKRKGWDISSQFNHIKTYGLTSVSDSMFTMCTKTVHFNVELKFYTWICSPFYGILNVLRFKEAETRSLEVRQQKSETDNVYINVFLFYIIDSDHMKCCYRFL